MEEEEEESLDSEAEAAQYGPRLVEGEDGQVYLEDEEAWDDGVW